MSQPNRRTAVVTGASAGIGEATAIRLADEGFDVVLGARRVEKLREVAERCGGRALPLDVSDPSSIEAFAAEIETADVLINNAGMARGVDRVEEISEGRLREMWETNVLGLVLVTQALLDRLEAGGNGHIVNIGSIAGFEVYRGGGGYTSTKHAVRALTRTLRLELLGRPVRVTEVAPGLVETDFSKVRFEGDPERSTAPYKGLVPLTGEDIADVIAWVVTRPPHVNIDEVVVRPLAQASATEIVRED